MALNSNVLSAIDSFIRGGFEESHRIIEIVCEEMHEEGEIDRDEVEYAVRRAAREMKEARRNWPPDTDCDKLNRVFGALNQNGIVALQYAGYTQSDGYQDVQEAFRQHANRTSVFGYCFYHAQDLEAALRGEGLYLAFGPIDPSNEEQDGSRVGALVMEQLTKHGLTASWSGAFSQRIHIPVLDWKRR